MAAELTENLLTVCSRQMFSRREPTQPQKVRKNMRTPTISSSIAGSTARQASAVSAEGETQNNFRYKRKKIVERAATGNT